MASASAAAAAAAAGTSTHAGAKGLGSLAGLSDAIQEEGSVMTRLREEAAKYDEYDVFPPIHHRMTSLPPPGGLANQRGGQLIRSGTRVGLSIRRDPDTKKLTPEVRGVLCLRSCPPSHLPESPTDSHVIRLDLLIRQRRALYTSIFRLPNRYENGSPETTPRGCQTAARREVLLVLLVVSLAAVAVVAAVAEWTRGVFVVGEIDHGDSSDDGDSALHCLMGDFGNVGALEMLQELQRERRQTVWQGEREDEGPDIGIGVGASPEEIELGVDSTPNPVTAAEVEALLQRIKAEIERGQAAQGGRPPLFVR